MTLSSIESITPRFVSLRAGQSILVLLSLNPTLLAQPIAPLARTIRDSVDTARATDTVERIYATDRWFTFPKFEETARYLRARLEESGVQQVEISGAPADGRTQAGFWTMPLAWDATGARLDVVAPEKFSLCDYLTAPTCLGMWSGSSPGVEAELVDLKTTAWKDVAGKLVLTRENAANLKAKLVQYGALGAVNAFTENPSLGDDRQWINAWGDHGWGYLESSTPLLSFSITPNQLRRLERLLAAGKVTLRAEAKTRHYEGRYPWVTGLLPGTTAEEVLVLGHTSEQGAHDNATGVAASIEALHILRKLIAAGKLPPPRRGIRVLLMPEMYGSLHYIQQHPERMKRTIASITVDTPAASYDLAGTEYTIYRSAHAGKSWTDALMPRIAQAVLPRGRPWHLVEHETGTDAYLSEPTVGVPNLWIYSGTGVVTHHNSADLPRTVDPRSLRDLVSLVATYLYYTASAGSQDANWLANVTLDAATDDLRQAASQGVDALAAGDSRAASFALARLSYLADRHQTALQGLKRLGSSSQLEQPFTERLRQFRDVQSARLREAGVVPYVRAPEKDNLVVRRKRLGTLPLDDLAAEKREGFPSGAWDKMVTVALYWCNGKRTVSEVAFLTEMEMGRPIVFDFAGYFRFLERHGYVDLSRTPIN